MNLKPCPFCGGEAHIVWNSIVKVRDGSGSHEERGVCIYCDNCPAEIRTTEKNLAKEMWNKRFCVDGKKQKDDLTQ